MQRVRGFTKRLRVKFLIKWEKESEILGGVRRRERERDIKREREEKTRGEREREIGCKGEINI